MSENILVVDDEKEIADLVGLYLRNEGYAVSVYNTGREALKSTEEHVYDLAILDEMCIRDRLWRPYAPVYFRRCGSRSSGCLLYTSRCV